VPQDHTRATTFGGRRPEDGRLAWRRPARELYNLVRAVTHPYPGAFTTWAGTKLLVWKATPLASVANAEPGRVAAVSPAGIVVGTGHGGLLLEQLQLEAGAEERGFDFARYRGVRAGDRLGDDAC
jgi:methionyl-tRNA formyltransferase